MQPLVIDMATQKCPRCGSNRTRRGYRPTPIFSKLVFRYNLLCDNCNWEFTGFGIPFTVSSKPTRKPKRSHENDGHVSADPSASGRANAPVALHEIHPGENNPEEPEIELEIELLEEKPPSSKKAKKRGNIKAGN